MIRAGILGGAGYTAGELMRILMHHPQVEIAFVQSSSQSGREVSEVHDDLLGEIQQHFVLEADLSVDVLFFCMGHGKSRSFLADHGLSEGIAIIDLSQDYRLADGKHQFVYGLPELNRSRIKKSKRIANCGCFATAIQLALLPLAEKGRLRDEIHVHAITGSTGAGQQPKPTTHFSWRNNNVSVYKAFEHQHLPEIRQSLRQLQPDFEQAINFIPIRGNFSRGIFASAYTHYEDSVEEARELYNTYYAGHPFVFVVGHNPSLKQVVNTNKCVLHIEKHDNKLLVISLIDNLVKGASGQAVQNMNLIFGLEETTGLNLKAVAF